MGKKITNEVIKNIFYPISFLKNGVKKHSNSRMVANFE